MVRELSMDLTVLPNKIEKSATELVNFPDITDNTKWQTTPDSCWSCGRMAYLWIHFSI